MDIREIRVGNYYYFNHTEISKKDQVVKIDLKMLFAMSNDPLHYGLEFYSPIAITEEILINAGLKVGYLGCHFNDWEVEFAYGKYLNKNLEADKLYLTINNAEYYISDIPIDYFHQLQNIIFDLTKKEIEFKV